MRDWNFISKSQLKTNINITALDAIMQIIFEEDMSAMKVSDHEKLMMIKGVFSLQQLLNHYIDDCPDPKEDVLPL